MARENIIINNNNFKKRIKQLFLKQTKKTKIIEKKNNIATYKK
jgi:hypothetical protein